MPLVRISLMKTSAERARQVADAVHQAMVDSIGIPVEDRFQILSMHEPHELIYDATFYGIERSDGFIAVQITLAAGRSTEVKTNLYRRMTELLKARLQVRPEDVFVSLVGVAPDDFSLGNGRAQFAEALPPHLQALQKSS